MNDFVDHVLEQWQAEHPELDHSPVAIFGRLSRVARAAEARMATDYARHGIDAGTYDVIATLRRTGAPYTLTARELQSGAMITSSAVAQRLNKLERLGLVTRRANTQDARVTDVTLTATGLTLIEDALPDHLETERAMLTALSDTERAHLASLLAALAASIDQAQSVDSGASDHPTGPHSPR
jgi:DNA-binding MarR family transcriptional regulator